jgi:hypothetical protein
LNLLIFVHVQQLIYLVGTYNQAGRTVWGFERRAQGCREKGPWRLSLMGRRRAIQLELRASNPVDSSSSESQLSKMTRDLLG